MLNPFDDCPSSLHSQEALQRSSGLDETGPVVWHLALCLLLGWILIGAALFKGIKSSGKVEYKCFLYTYPWLPVFLMSNFCPI